MTRVYAGLGSNADKEKNIPAGLNALANYFSPLTTSKTYESEPLGFNGDNFYNLVVGFDTDLSVLEVVGIFKSIESSLGRLSPSQNTTSETISHTPVIDLLLFGDLIQHDDQIKCTPE
jgi:2-amino-4-hydroxy-6-hydroxymethyldihydropteridine diphosphokinase